MHRSWEHSALAAARNWPEIRTITKSPATNTFAAIPTLFRFACAQGRVKGVSNSVRMLFTKSPNYSPNPYSVIPLRLSAYITSRGVTVVLHAISESFFHMQVKARIHRYPCSVYSAASRMTPSRNILRAPRMSSYMLCEARLTPPRRARRRSAGFVIPAATYRR